MKRWWILGCFALCRLSAAVPPQEGAPLEYFKAGIQAMEQNNWRRAHQQFAMSQLDFADASFSEDLLYYQAVCDYHLMEYDLANKKLDDYLQQRGNAKFFEDAVAYKLAIAHKFRAGARKHLLGSEKLPKVVSAKEDALEIYDQITSALPNHDLAAQAFYAKADMLKSMQDYKESIECLNTLLKRFPKHPLSSEAYLLISKIYYEQSFSEFHNPDFLELADLNLKRFIQNFPRDEHVEESKKMFFQMQELHAKGLYETGLFYERTKRPKASVIYYVTALEKFPQAECAKACKERLQKLGSSATELEVPQEFLK